MDYVKGSVITDDFIIKNIDQKKTLVEIVLEKDSEQITAILRDNIDLFLRTFNVDSHVICKAKISIRKQIPKLEIIQIKKYVLDDEDMLEVDNLELTKRFDNLIEKVKDRDYRFVLDEFFGIEDIKELFFSIPASKSNHHAYPFGLLEHSVEVAEIAIAIGSFYEIDEELLITSSLLHDIGKVKSYEIEKNKIQKTDWEHLMGHLSISALFISKMLPSDFDSQKAMLLYHMILSHHGDLKYGSPIICKTKEAFILHKADVISSTMNHVENLKYGFSKWSEFDTLNQRTWFNGKS